MNILLVAMLDLTLEPPPSALGQTQDRPALAARTGSPGPAQTQPYADLFQRGFDAAYDLPGQPLRGEQIQANVQTEARTFGDVWTVRALEEERFGAAANPAANQALVAGLRTEPGRETVLNAEKEGPRTPGTGDDVVVLLDREAAAAFGHTAVMIGNDTAGWDLFSKDGTDNRWLGGTLGRPTWTNEKGQGQTSGTLSRHYATLDDFFRDGNIADRYEAAVRVEFNGGANMGAAARAGARAILREPYDVLQSSCAHTVENALEQIQKNPSYGITGFNVRETTAFRSLIRPEVQFTELGLQEGRDDVVSQAQRDWEVRSAFDGR